MKASFFAAYKIFLTTSFGWFLGHAFGQSYIPAEERSAYDYFDRVGDKSFYQQQKIEFMKDELNDYSRRLHSLQEKFNQRFFGLGSGGRHQNPFAQGEAPPTSMPKIDAGITEPILPSERAKRRTPIYSKSNDSQKLAFEVNGPAVSTDNLTQDSSSEITDLGSSPSLEKDVIEDQAFPIRPKNTGSYLILRPGVTFPYRAKTSHFPGNKSKHREYDPGFLLSLSGGYQWNGFSFGGGGLYRKNRHDRKHSYEKSGGVKYDFISKSASSTLAGFLEFGYEHRFNDWFKFYSNINLGYGVSVVEDYSDQGIPAWTNRRRIDTTFITGAAAGIGFHGNESFSFLFGYRFLHEDEVPAHALEIGINGLF
jgi:hypothetical protein